MKTLLHKLRDALIARAMLTPYFHIYNSGSLYMRRYWLWGGTARDFRSPAKRGWKGSVIDRWIGRWLAARVHQIVRSDRDRHLHDHPCWSISIVLIGGYWEVLPKHQSQTPGFDDMPTDIKRIWRKPGAIVFRRATDRHRIEIKPNAPPTWSLFILGPKNNKWGFYTPRGKVYWRKYLNVPEESA